MALSSSSFEISTVWGLVRTQDYVERKFYPHEIISYNLFIGSSSQLFNIAKVAYQVTLQACLVLIAGVLSDIQRID